MITTQPQQESTFLQDLQTGLDEFQAENKLGPGVNSPGLFFLQTGATRHPGRLELSFCP